MPANEYAFLTEWRVTAPIELVYDILKDGNDYKRWWPDVYLESDYIPSGDPNGIGDQVVLLTKGWLPYKLRWTATAERRERPHTIAIRASGDFNGRGVWQLQQVGEECDIKFDWRLTADKPLLRWLSPLFKPIFKWNHRWAMERGHERLQQEIVRRRTEENTFFFATQQSKIPVAS
ncbi:MAG: SRPBCC family protein [Blastocatellia bacterium]